MLILPAIDLRDGKAVRLRQGKAEAQTNYFDDPTIPAKDFAAAGAERLHVVDLDGAFDGVLRNLPVIERILKATPVPIEVGGGIRTYAAAEQLAKLGVVRIILGTRAIEDFRFLRELSVTHPGSITLGLDVIDGKVATRGWTVPVEITAEAVLKRANDLSLGEVIATDVGRDGMLQGPNHKFYEQLMKWTRFPIIASGGVSTVEDIRRCKEQGCYGAIIGKAIYDKKLDLREAIAAAR
ncbi:MAG TPA: 1-(5-phosphoribosyl)-5-[(5-phosphoribosylamino)methylideneamino]imidazole-4-carboxamide isomerase [Planctomycetota bacterium]|nr:1-(5-phosphoribosyl)-5-[(5-phosphoribosylamino)methylideneamino]imidazole-4-carboxamide isomerase [Planctomycetota bacterium]